MTAFILNVIASTYFMSDRLAQTPAAQELVNSVDGGFLALLSILKQGQPSKVIQTLLKIFTFTAATFLVLTIALVLSHTQSSVLSGIVAVGFSGSVFCLGSLFWVFRHQKVLKEFVGILLFFVGGSLLLPGLDLLTHIGITHAVYVGLTQNLRLLINIPSSGSLPFEALVVTATFAGMLIATYVLIWLYAIPVSLFAWLIAVVPIYFARTIHRAFPKQPLAAPMFAVWLVSLVYLSFSLGK